MLTPTSITSLDQGREFARQRIGQFYPADNFTDEKMIATARREVHRSLISWVAGWLISLSSLRGRWLASDGRDQHAPQGLDPDLAFSIRRRPTPSDFPLQSLINSYFEERRVPQEKVKNRERT